MRKCTDKCPLYKGVRCPDSSMDCKVTRQMQDAINAALDNTELELFALPQLPTETNTYRHEYREVIIHKFHRRKIYEDEEEKIARHGLAGE